MQKLFSAAQIKAWDTYTIQHEPISSLALMERASLAFVNWFCTKFSSSQYPIYIFCGAGNNGGDGFAICRLLTEKGYHIKPYLVTSKNTLSPDCYNNYKKLTQVQDIYNVAHIKKLTFDKNSIIIDALFGSGLTRPLKGFLSTLVNHLNLIKALKISVDIPSGMHCDTVQHEVNTIFKSDYTISFQIPKRAFFFPENKAYIKKYIVVPIGLSNHYYTRTITNWLYCNRKNITIPPDVDVHNTLPDKTTSSDYIRFLIHKAKEKQHSIYLKYESEFFITPKEKVYLLF